MEQDGFELRLRLSKFLSGAASNEQNCRGAVALCLKNAELAEELVECFIESLREEMKCRRAILAALAALFEDPNAGPYRTLIEDRFPAMVEVCLEGPQSWRRNAAKGLKNLYGCFGEGLRHRLHSYCAMINEALGLTENEQRFQSEKQRILDQVERDREGHKALRERCWARPPNESFKEEFLSLLGEASLRGFGTASQRIARQNQGRFCELNDITMAAKTRPSPERPPARVVIIHLNEVLNTPRLDERDPKIRQVLTDVLQCIKDIARSCFFFSDLRNYEQPHVNYYGDDDDGRSLEDYDFGGDALSRFVKGEGSSSGDSKFYRERAYRYRESAFRYQTDRILFQGMSSGPQSPLHAVLVELLSKDLIRDMRRRLSDLDHLTKGSLHRNIKLIRELAKYHRPEDHCMCRDEALELCFLSNDHLSLALARLVYLGINDVVRAKSLYSTTKYDSHWVMSEIRLKYGAAASYTVLAASNITKFNALKLGFDYVDIRGAADMELAVQELMQGKRKRPRAK